MNRQEERVLAISRADTGLAGRLVRGEFCELCLDMLWDVEMSTVQRQGSKVAPILSEVSAPSALLASPEALGSPPQL